jgi:hypothetical protein
MNNMRRYNLLVFLTLITVAAQAQFINLGATVTIQSGATLRVETNIENNGTGTITNNGTIEVSGNFTNAGTATLTPGAGLVKFIGSANTTLDTGGDALFNVEMAKTSNATVALSAPATVAGNLSFTGAGSKIVLGANDLTLASSTVVSATTDHSTNGYVVTGSTGRLVRTNLGPTPFTYPVGFDVNTYNPITIAENGTIDNIGVRVLERAYENGVSGTHIASEVVDASWVISEANAGNSNLTITPQWLLADEMPSFTRTDCGVSKYVGPAYDLLLAGMGAATGMGTVGDLYKRIRSGVTPGTFVVGDDKVMDYVAVSPKVFLGGPTPVSGEMPDNLRTLNLIPIAEPYTSLSGFTHVGRGGGENVTSNAIFNQVTGNGTQDDIVDWGFVELRSPASTVISTKSVLIQRDGDIVETDMSSVKFRGHNAGNYSFAFRHRNHLGIATSSAIALTSSPTVLNFTDGSAATFGTNAQRNLAGVRMLWPGNVIHDGIVRYQGSSNDRDAIKNNILSQPGNSVLQLLSFSYNGYQLFDANMNGTIRYQGAANDGDLIKDFILAHPSNSVLQLLSFTINQQLP